MAEPTTIKGGKVKVLLGNDASPIVYAAPCGFSQRTVTLNKGLEEVNIPDCDDPDAVNWLGRDAVSLSMTIAGEGVLAAESVETWLDAFDDVESVPVKVEWLFPAKTITWTGRMHVENFEAGAQDGRRVTGNVTMQSDGKMTRVVTPVP
ncbi:phage tail tube protein [Shinella sp. BYT-45]|uniref:phage tail tube protein n=1 Tax=Shinella sp. BYT-45 TaxID=3377377 RepID=UPI00398161B6